MPRWSLPRLKSSAAPLTIHRPQSLFTRERFSEFTTRGHSLMVKFQPSKLAMRVRFPLPAHFFSPSEKDMNESRWTLSDVLTISSDRVWHQSLKTHISRREARSGLPVTTASGATERFGGS